ncbi:uncharacterized protein LOC103703889 isoform X3 [Phoenix dactylifera]|uniref:Uncharacterized protein LOC103703889 isoform X3 n=2 Tax=Phoenix dactylifera TaxID=42345 RepID=A0A8B9A9E5_PHODC|nr:uncharacterized protein LOC103703889 isoform X3 [Phoenix dactylifera]
MVERFFSTRQIGGPDSIQPMTLLSGPPCRYFLFFGDSGKTSLLFQFAINCTSESFGDVVFICNKRRLENKPPFLSHGVDPASDALQHIQIKYVEDDEGIKKFFASFHLHESFPVAVIIDDFGDFFSDKNCQQRYNNARGRDLAMVRTLALCWDAIAHANKKLQPKASCSLLVADTHQGDSPRLLFIYKRWIQCIFTIQGDGSGSYILKNSCISGNRQEGTRIAKYSIALQHLALEEPFLSLQQRALAQLSQMARRTTQRTHGLR